MPSSYEICFPASARPRQQLLLRPYAVGFPEPPGDLIVNLFDSLDSKMMNEATGRHLLNLGEPRMLKPPGKHDVRVQAALAQLIDSGKYHPNLKADSRLCRGDEDRTA